MASNLKILIVEPNTQLLHPYMLFPAQWKTLRENTVESALATVRSFEPDLVCISTSFALTKSVRLLEALKNLSVHKLIPVVFVIDFSHRVSHIPGTTWGGKIGIIHSLSSKKELDSTISRVLQP